MRVFAVAVALSIAIGVAAPMSAMAQSTTVIGQEGRTCHDRPARPEWIENIDVREAHKGVLVQTMYRAQGMQTVAETGECTCDNRFPSWDAAQDQYFKNYSAMERWEILDRNREYLRAANDSMKVARPICEQQGNW